MQRLLHVPNQDFTSNMQRTSEFLKNLIDVILKAQCTNGYRNSSLFISATEEETLLWTLFLDRQKSVA